MTTLQVTLEVMEPIPVDNDIRQGNSLGPLLFNTTMDTIIKSISHKGEYKMGCQKLKNSVLCR